jgi:hypothetical protein
MSGLLLRGRRGARNSASYQPPRQCGDDMLRILVTGGPPNLGGGIPHRIIVSSRSVPTLRITGAG